MLKQTKARKLNQADDNTPLIKHEASDDEEITEKTKIMDYRTVESEEQNNNGNGFLDDDVKPKKAISDVHKRVITFLILLCVLIGNMERTLFGPVYPTFATQHKNLTEVEVGTVIGASSFATCVSCFAWSFILPMLGARATYAIGIVGSGVSSALLSPLVFIHNSQFFFSMSILVRVIVGIFSAASYISELTIVAGLFPDKTGTIMGMMLGASYLGKMLGPLFGGALFEYIGYYLPFIIPAVILVIVGISIVPVIPSSFKVPIEERKGTCGRYCQMASLPMFTVCSLLVGVQYAVTGMNISILALRLEEYNLGPTQVGLIFFSYTVAYFLAACIAGMLDDKIGNRKLGIAMVIIAFSLAGGCLTLQGPAPFYQIGYQPLWLLIFSFCMQSVFALGVVPAISIMFESVKVLYLNEVESNSLVSGYLWGFATGGQAVGAVVGSVLYQYVGWAWVTSGSGLVIWFLVLILGTIGCYVHLPRKGDLIMP